MIHRMQADNNGVTPLINGSKNGQVETVKLLLAEGQLGDLKVGDKVRFTFRWDGKTAEIESIDKL